MALGKRKPVQQPLFVTTTYLHVRANPFYDAINKVLAAHHFDAFAEELCDTFYDGGSRGGRRGRRERAGRVDLRGPRVRLIAEPSGHYRRLMRARLAGRQKGSR